MRQKNTARPQVAAGMVEKLGMATSPVTSAVRLSPKAGQWLLGNTPRVRGLVSQMLVSYAVWLALHAYRAFGLTMAGQSLSSMLWPVVFDVLWMGSFFLLVRSSAAERWKDPALTSWQVGFALLSVVFCFVMVDVGRSVALVQWVLALGLGLSSLTSRQVVRLGVVSWLLMAACLWLLNLGEGVGIDTNRETLALLGAGLTLPWLAWVAARLAHFRQAYEAQRRDINRTLTRLGELTTHDPLTGLTDHHHMQELLRTECKRHARNGLVFSLALLSIDDLPRINTQYGASQGDTVIRQLGQLSVQHLRTSDVVARWSRHEFLVLMPETDLPGAYRSIERLREFLSTRWGFYNEGRWVPADCASGITHFRMTDTPQSLMHRVEQALQDSRRAQPAKVGETAP